MRLVDVNCPSCGAQLRINSEDRVAECPYCGHRFLIDDEVQHIQYDNAEQAGYEFEKGRQKAQREAYRERRSAPRRQAPQKKPHGSCIMILLWIMFFPFMLTIWIWRTDRIRDKKIKGILTAVLWVIVALICVAEGGSSTTSETASSDTAIESVTSEAVTEENADEEELFASDDKINHFLNNYNKANPDDQITADMFSVYNHHGTAHEDQAKGYKDDMEIVITDHLLINVVIQSNTRDLTDEDFKLQFMRFAKAYDTSLTNETLEDYWSQIKEDSTNNVKFDQFEVDLQYFENAPELMTIDGKIAE